MNLRKRVAALERWQSPKAPGKPWKSVTVRRNPDGTQVEADLRAVEEAEAAGYPVIVIHEPEGTERND
jgi:hypothetical protein